MVRAEKLTAVKQFMRLDGNDNDILVALLYGAAARYLKNAGIEEPPENKALYNLAVWCLTLHYYDHRDDVGNEAGIPTGLRPIINQLKLIGNAAMPFIIEVGEEKLAAAKCYMRIDGDDDDDIVAALYEAAVLYLWNAGIEEPSEDPSLYNLAVWSLTLHYYDHRDAVGNEASFPIGLRPIINQLKLMGDVSCSISQ